MPMNKFIVAAANVAFTPQLLNFGEVCAEGMRMEKYTTEYEASRKFWLANRKMCQKLTDRGTVFADIIDREKEADVKLNDTKIWTIVQRLIAQKEQEASRKDQQKLREVMERSVEDLLKEKIYPEFRRRSNKQRLFAQLKEQLLQRVNKENKFVLDSVLEKWARDIIKDLSSQQSSKKTKKKSLRKRSLKKKLVEPVQRSDEDSDEFVQRLVEYEIEWKEDRLMKKNKHREYIKQLSGLEYFKHEAKKSAKIEKRQTRKALKKENHNQQKIQNVARMRPYKALQFDYTFQYGTKTRTLKRGTICQLWYSEPSYGFSEVLGMLPAYRPKNKLLKLGGKKMDNWIRFDNQETKPVFVEDQDERENFRVCKWCFWKQQRSKKPIDVEEYICGHSF